MSPGTGAAIFGCAGPVLGRDEAAFFREYDPAGFIVFNRNLGNPSQIRRLTEDLRAAVGREAPIFIDQEGGRVQRLGPPHWREWLPPLDFVAAASGRAERAMELRYALTGAELAALGIHGNCAPVLDLAGAETHPFLKNRCYGGDPMQVARLGWVVARGLLSAGVLPVMKHLPGHGRARLDTHYDLPRVTAPRATLRKSDFAPFRALAALPLAMTAHVVFTAYDDRPATLSPALLRAIRRDIGFQGVLMTDDLNMEALSGTLAERTRSAMDAGCDLALHCSGDLAEMREVAGAAGEMTSAAASRMTRALRFRQPQALDIAAMDAELKAIMDSADG